MTPNCIANSESGLVYVQGVSLTAFNILGAGVVDGARLSWICQGNHTALAPVSGY